MTRRLKVYVAGPYTQGDTVANTRQAIVAGTDLWADGFSPFIPHLNLLWDIVLPHHYESWMNYDIDWLSVCDAMLRLPGPSAGADRETKYANENGIPVFTCLLDLKAWRDNASNLQRA